MTDEEKTRAIEEVLRRYRERTLALEHEADAAMKEVFKKVRERRLAEVRAKIKAHAK